MKKLQGQGQGKGVGVRRVEDDGLTMGMGRKRLTGGEWVGMEGDGS